VHLRRRVARTAHQELQRRRYEDCAANLAGRILKASQRDSKDRLSQTPSTGPFPIVMALLAAGAGLLGMLTSWQLNLDNAYQQRFLVKLALVGVILAIAAYNKLRLTPRLAQDPLSGGANLRRSIRIKSLLALLILAATAWALSTSPDAIVKRNLAVPTGVHEVSKNNDLRKSGKANRSRVFRGVPRVSFPPI
jgi:hypothetical protein